MGRAWIRLSISREVCVGCQVRGAVCAALGGFVHAAGALGKKKGGVFLEMEN